MLRELYDYLKTGQQRGNVLVDMADVDSFDYGFKELHWHIMRVQDILHGRDDTMVVSFYAPTQLTFGMAASINRSRMWMALCRSMCRTHATSPWRC